MLKILFAAALAAGIATASAQAPAPQPASVQLKALLDDDLAAVFRRSPWQATVRGVPGYDHLLPDLSFATLETERARERDALEELKAIDARALRGQDRVSYELLRDKMEASVEAQRFARAEGLVLSTLGGVQNAMPRMAQTTPFRTADNYRDFIKRISATPKFAHETIERLRAGMKSGWLSQVPVLDRVVAAIDAHVVDAVEDSTLLTPFRNFASGVPEDQRGAVTAAARRATAEDYQPALRRFKAFIVNEYRPRAPQVAGAAALTIRAKDVQFPPRPRVGPGAKAPAVHPMGPLQPGRPRRANRAVPQHGRQLHARIASARHQRLLHDQRARLQERGDVADRDALRARSRTGPPHADRASGGDGEAPPLALDGKPERGVHRGLGALRGEARLRSRPLQGSLPALRAPAGRALSRRAARRRYRHPCVQLAARQGHRVHGRPGWPGPGFRGERSRSLLLQSFAGPRIHARPAQVPRAARPCGEGPPSGIRCARFPCRRDR